MKKFKPLLIDFDGVIKIGKELASDAKSFFDFIDSNHIPACILSNSTLRTAEMMRDFLSQKGLELKIPAFTAFDVTLEYVKHNYQRVKVYCRDYLLHYFNGLISYENPQAVVIGDIGDKWNFETMNQIFNYVIKGADIVAMHKNKFWMPEGKPILDTGAFITAIEYASDKKAIIIGKPSPLYFKTALEQIGFSSSEEFFMISDDIENDVLAAQKIGGKGILMLAGKSSKEDIKDGKPDYVCKSLTEVIKIISD
ncbi:HAD hydrolase-like protein [Ignavibacterium sp.]|uniref:HAD-IIA family hydrolase n=1 Tax=Ignavibacterium sp. TaxID=2651167 RepID=UPI00307D4ED5